MKNQMKCLLAAALLVGCVPVDDVASTTATPPTPADSETPATAEDTRETIDDESTTTEPETTDAPDETGRCTGPDPMARCDADPDTFDGYGTAALVSAFELLEGRCCADFDDDGELDNALGQGFADIGKLDDLNTELKNSLLDGSQTIVLELDGLDDLESDDELSVHVWNARWDDFDEVRPGELHPVLLERASIEQGVAPIFSFDTATVEDGILSASKGEIELQVTVNGVAISPRVHDVTIQGELAAGSADPEQGVTIRDAEVGGRVALRDISEQINGVARGCECLGLDGPLVDDDPQADVGVCQRPDTATCDAEGRTHCADLVEVCPVVDILTANMADIDADGDGVIDSISLGAVFDAERATIEGVALAGGPTK